MEIIVWPGRHENIIYNILFLIFHPLQLMENVFAISKRAAMETRSNALI